MNNYDEYFMKEALKEAQKAYQKEEVPIGAILVIDGKIISRGHSLKITKSSPIAHAEVIAIEKASKKLKRWILDDATLYVTVEPCLMCVGAILQARLKRVVYGASQEKFGALGGVINILENNNFNHQTQVTSGVLQKECAQLMKDFFAKLR